MFVYYIYIYIYLCMYLFNKYICIYVYTLDIIIYIYYCIQYICLGGPPKQKPLLGSHCFGLAPQGANGATEISAPARRRVFLPPARLGCGHLFGGFA